MSHRTKRQATHINAVRAHDLIASLQELPPDHPERPAMEEELARMVDRYCHHCVARNAGLKAHMHRAGMDEDDIAQEVNLRLLQRIQDPEPITDVPTYLQSVMGHCCADVTRNAMYAHTFAQADRDREEDDHTLKNGSDVRNGPIRRTSGLEWSARQEKQLEEMSHHAGFTANEKEVVLAALACQADRTELLTLYYFGRDGMPVTYEEMAAIFEVSVNTIKTRLFRGKNELKEKLLDDGHDHIVAKLDALEMINKSKTGDYETDSYQHPKDRKKIAHRSRIRREFADAVHHSLDPYAR